VQAGRKKLKMKMSKKQAAPIIKECKNILVHRRNNAIRKEQAAYERLIGHCDKINVDPSAMLSQYSAHLRNHSIAATMNGFV